MAITVIIFSLLLTCIPLAFGHSCPSYATTIRIGLSVSVTHPNDQPLGPAGCVPGDELWVRVALVYARLNPDESVNAAVENGRLFLRIKGDTTDVTPDGGVPLVGGAGAEGCDGTNYFVSYIVPYSVTVADMAAGTIPIVGIYTNGTAHLGEADQIGVVSASQSYQVPMAQRVPCPVVCSITPETNRVCTGQSAAFVVVATNGFPPYHFSWSGPNAFSSTNASITLSNVQVSNGGLYTVAVTDSGECTSFCEARLFVNPAPACAVRPETNAVCIGTSAAFTADIFSEDGPFAFSWTGPNGFTSTNQTVTISNVQPIHGGVYTNVVTDRNGCSSICTAGLIVHPRPIVTVSPATNEVCAGSTASFTGNVAAGEGPYEFAWSGPAGFSSTNQTISVSNAGLYPVVLTDAQGCSAAAEARLIINANPVCGITPPRTNICLGSCLPLRFSAISGQPPYTSVLATESGPIATNIFTDAFTNLVCPTVLGSNVYTSTIVDANGCANSCTAVVVVNPNPVCTIFPSATNLCLGNCVNLLVTPSGGNGPYAIVLSQGSPIATNVTTTNHTFTVCPARVGTNSYSASVIDANGCSALASTTVLVNPNPVCGIIPAATNVCLGSCVPLRISATGGRAPYTSVLSTASGPIATNIFADAFTNLVCPAVLGSNVYTSTIVDANGCANSCTAVVVVNPNPVCTIFPSATNLCFGTCVNLLVTPSEGNGPYTIVLSHGSPIATNVTITNGTFTVCPAAVGTNSYSVSVTDANGCFALATTTVLVNPNPVCAMVPAATKVCLGSCVSLRISATSGRAPYISVLTTASGPIATNIFTDAFTNLVCPPLLGSNVYSATTVDANGCSASCSAVVIVNENPVCSITPTTNAVCAGSPATFTVAISQGAGPFLIQWTGPNGFSSTGAVVAVRNVQSTDAGVYTVVVSDRNGCTNTCEALLVVNPNPLCTVTPATNDMCLGASPSFTVNPSSGTPPYRFSWTGPAGFSSTNQTITISNAQPLRAGQYASVVTDANGCMTTCFAMLFVDNPVCSITPSVPAVCLGTCLDLNVQPAGGFAPYLVVVRGPDGFAATNSTTTNVGVHICPPALGSNTYQAFVTDAKGCATTCQTVVVANAPINGPAIVCPQTVNTYTVARGTNQSRIYQWQLLQNNSAARIISNNGPAVAVYSGTNGSYLLHLNVIAGESLIESCDHVSRIVDTVPPTIACGNSLVVAENPRSSGASVVQWAPPVASDNCDTNPVVTCVPPSGSSFPVGQTTVTCTARDDLDNRASCSFTVKVVPFVIIVVTSVADSGPGTLRQAFIDANATPGPNVIRFQLPGTPPQTIRPLTPLPAITEPVRIEGLPSGTSNAVPAVILDGSLVQVPSFAPPDTAAIGTDSDGLVLIASSNVVRGLIINNFRTGIRVEGAGGNRIEANWIGTDATGLMAAPNSGNGILISSSANTIGGLAHESGNVISGNAVNGIQLDGIAAHDNKILGNKIGLAADGHSPLANGSFGIRLVNGANRNTIGTTAERTANLIGFNAEGGVILEGTTGTGNRISGNNIGANGGLAIDLGHDGVTSNDPLDADTGPNDYQNFPEVTAARSDTVSSTTVIGTFGGSPLATFDLEFFVYPADSSPGLAEGQIFLGTKRVTTDALGNAPFETVFPVASFGHQFVVMTATDGRNNTSEFSPPLKVQPPPVIDVPPPTTVAVAGSTATLSAGVTGEGTLQYQWLLNGVIIPDATNALLDFANLDLTQAGAYSLAVANESGAVLSAPGGVLLDLPQVEGNDAFVHRTALSGRSGVISGSNGSSSREPGEPLHSGKPGGKSVWYTWTPLGTGIATIETVGSSFDTLLGVYTGTSVSNLTEVAADEDDGGFLRSRLRFNAVQGTNYHFAVDGFGGATGRFVFRWEFMETEDLLPKILRQPSSVAVPPGGRAEFSVYAISGCVDAQRTCRRDEIDPPPTDPPPNDLPKPESIILYYQWYFNGQPIPGATNTNYVVINVQEQLVGDYTVRVTKFGRTTESRRASLQINLTGDASQNALAATKFLDAANGTPIVLGGAGTPPRPPRGLLQAAQVAGTIVRGYTGTQVFDASGGGAASVMCNVVAGNSVWVTFVPQDSGVLYLNTDGSSYNTVMEVFTYSAVPGVLQRIDCDNNSGLDGRDSAVAVTTQTGVTNFVLIGGVNGATGTLKVNYSLVTSSLLVSLGKTPQGHVQIRISGHPAMRFRLEVSTDFVDWSELITTNAATGIFDFTDPNSVAAPGKAYRAVMLP